MKTFKEIRKTLNEKVYRPPGRTSTLGGIMLQGFKKQIERSKMSKIDEKKLTKMWGDWCMKKGGPKPTQSTCLSFFMRT